MLLGPQKSTSIRSYTITQWDPKFVSSWRSNSLSPLSKRNHYVFLIVLLMLLVDLNILHSVQENRGLIALNGTFASPKQQRGLVCFREIGFQYFEAYVKYYILHDPSAMVPQQKWRLQTFTVLKKRPTEVKLKEREQKFISQCLQKYIVGMECQPQCTIHGQQYLELPRALCTPSGEPYKGQKSYTTKFNEKNTIMQFWEGSLVCGPLTLLLWRVCPSSIPRHW